MIKVELKGADKMIADLKRMREKAVPFALRNALNTAAFETRQIWQREIRGAFINRSSFTERSIRVEQASRGRLTASVGSVAPYMGTQEEGGNVTKGGHKPVPGPVAAGQAPGAKRTRLVRARFHLGAINVAHPGLHGPRKQQNAIAIAAARKAGKNIVLLTRPSGGKGLFIISGGKRVQTRTRLLWDVSRSSVHVPATHTLERALAAVRPKLQHMLEAALVQQMQRFNVGT